MEWKDIKNIRGLRSVTLIGSSNIIGSAITSIFWISIASLIGADSYGELSYFLAIIGIAAVIAMIGGGYTMQVYTAKKVKIESSLYLIGIITSTVAAITLFLIFENLGVSISVVGIVAFNFILFEILGKKLYKKYFKVFGELSTEISILAYDAIGLIYLSWVNNKKDFKLENLYTKNGFKGMQGEFIIRNNLSYQKLKMYKISDKKFIEIF